MMIQVGEVIVSRELFDKQFICHLEKCEGNCCVFGDSGAPLELEEAEALREQWGKVRPWMRQEGIRAVEEKGAWMTDRDGDRVTPLVGDEECAYAVFENGIARCSVEQAYESGAVPFQKPLSCHLYPVRLSRLGEAVAVNYHQWSICEPARLLGKKEGVPVFRFLRESLIRRFGPEFYSELESIYRDLSAGDGE